ncbi:MAG TPA: metalloregulator ArsR/SmtB family transcription factor [Bacteroidia bacterium]|nr:helix-turn-helix transcriptional regulator [Sphingobacteriales bacterium]HPD64949.1 metalloregulator ArsR/SmtB family transcription factor [Bacteroidia bacterium]HRS58177.1 metalloregulator ArsR/SmtB family transcription factor [Bacteroidia bacterium]HRU67507.1 metalloregulator ArsR/SmtB family transcription factor [Bacteroidia bacterium]
MAKRKKEEGKEVVDTPITRALDSDKLDCMASKLKALGHPARIAIIELLEKNDKLPVGKIQAMLDLEQAATSNHLRILKDQNIVKSVRDGKSKLYSLRTPQIKDIIDCIEKCKD